MKLTGEDRDLPVRGLFELTIAHVEDDDELRAEIKDIAGKLGGDPEAVFFGAVPPQG
jgi:hypothetical protein